VVDVKRKEAGIMCRLRAAIYQIKTRPENDDHQPDPSNSAPQWLDAQDTFVPNDAGYNCGERSGSGGDRVVPGEK